MVASTASDLAENLLALHTKKVSLPSISQLLTINHERRIESTKTFAVKVGKYLKRKSNWTSGRSLPSPAASPTSNPQYYTKEVEMLCTLDGDDTLNILEPCHSGSKDPPLLVSEVDTRNLEHRYTQDSTRNQPLQQHSEQTSLHPAEDQSSTSSSNGDIRSQLIKHKDDSYTPRYVRYIGQNKQGLCELCPTEKWLQLKDSAFWYHKQ
jgi:hypothetical protein